MQIILVLLLNRKSHATKYQISETMLAFMAILEHIEFVGQRNILYNTIYLLCIVNNIGGKKLKNIYIRMREGSGGEEKRCKISNLCAFDVSKCIFKKRCSP